MINNPFLSKTYQDIWKKHFIKNKAVQQFDGINDLRFYQKGKLPLFINIGRNMTNAITYDLSSDAISIKNKVLLIYDVPNYHKIETNNNRYCIKKIPQYIGYINKLNQSITIDNFLNKHFDSKQRNKFRRCFKLLESNHEVVYEVLNVKTEINEYHDVMSQFKELLEIRFNDLSIENDILQKWDFYLDLVYPLMKENKALLNLIKINGKVGAISLVFLSQNSIIGAVKAFDINFKKYGLGKLELIKLIERSIGSKYSILDFSKGDHAYKKRFVDESYIFDYHIIYDSKSVVSIIIANTLKIYFEFKQYLRDKNVNVLYWKIKYKLKML